MLLLKSLSVSLWPWLLCILLPAPSLLMVCTTLWPASWWLLPMLLLLLLFSVFLLMEILL
jgi:hypothetical protein